VESELGIFDKFRRDKKEEPKRRDELAQVGILIGTSDELEKRLEARQKFYEQLQAFRQDAVDEETKEPLPPEQQIMLMAKALDQIDDLLKASSIPWGRAGSVDWYRQAMSGWEGLLSIAKSDLLTCLRILKTSKRKLTDKWDLVHKMRRFLVVEVLRYAQYIEDVSFFDADITPKYNLVLPQAPMYPMGSQPAPRPGTLMFPIPYRQEKPSEEEG